MFKYIYNQNLKITENKILKTGKKEKKSEKNEMPKNGIKTPAKKQERKNWKQKRKKRNK